MPGTFRLDEHGPRQLRTTTLCGLVFGSFSANTPPSEDFIGPDVVGEFRRVVAERQIELSVGLQECLPNNWKMYAENALTGGSSAVMIAAIRYGVGFSG
jgi:anthranilate 1,2-dioxygenase large subunit